MTAAGRILLVDEEQGRLWTRNPATDEMVGANDLLYGGEGSGRGSFQRAVDVALAGDDAVLILDRELRKVEKVRIAFEEDGEPLPAFGYPFRVTRGPDVLPVSLRAIRHPEGAEPLFVLRPRQTAVRVLPTRPQRFTTVYGDDARFFVPVEEEGQLFAQSLSEANAASLNDSVLVVSDPGEDRFAVYSRSDGSLIGTFGDNYEDQRSLDDPEGIVVLDDGRIAIADRGNDRVAVFSPDLATLLGSYPLPEAYGLAAFPRGDLAAWNEEGRIVLRIAADGSGRQRVPSNLLPEQVSGLAFDHLGNLFVLNRESGRVTVLDPAVERVLTRIGSGGRMEEPRGLAADREGNVYVTDESDSGRTYVFRWDVHSPELTGVAFDYREEPRLEWNPGPRRFLRGYQVQAATSSDGPFRVLATTQDSALVLAADSAADAAAVPDDARYVRIAPVIVNGVVGDPTPSLPIVDYTAISAYEAEDWERALEDASEAVDLVESGALEVPEEFRGLLPWIAFEAAYRSGAYGRAVERIDELSTDDLARHSLESRYHQLVPRAYQRAGENQRALDAAREALDRIEEGSLDLDEPTRRDLMWVAFTGAFEQENYRAVVGWGERLRESVSSARRVEFFSRLPRAQLFLGVPDSAAVTLLSIGGQDPRAEYYQDSTVVDLSFDIYRELLTLNRPPAWAASGQAAGGGPGGVGGAGPAGETASENPGLQFLREYVRSIPGSAQGLRSAYQDSLTVFTTRADLGDAIESWRNADYAQVVRTLQAVLEGEDLAAETEVVGRQLLAAAFFTFGRQEDAADAFEGLLEVRSDVNVEEESERLERLYGLDVYSPDMTEYFRGLLPGSASAADPDAAELASTRSPPGAPRPPDA